MLTINLDTQEAPNAYVAARDCARRSRMMSEQYTSAQRSEALVAVDTLSMAFNWDAVYTNFRQKFIAIKVVGQRTRDKAYAKLVDKIFTEKGYTKAVTAQGTVYRIAKK
jgi:hypothetical protein